jgi:hypothetical protein
MADRSKHLIPLIVMYFASIFIFAAVYWINWNVNTSSFIVTNEFNESTVNLFSLYEKNYKIDVGDVAMPFSINDMNRELAPFIILVSRLNSKISETDRRISAFKLAEDTLTLRMEKNFDQNLGQVLADSLKPLAAKKDSLERALAQIPPADSTRTASLGRSDSEMAAARLRLELSINEYETFKITSQIQSEGLKQRRNFIDVRLIGQSDLLNADILALYHDSTLLNDSLVNTQSNVRTLINKFHQNRMDKVKYLDFVYYSVVTATSTGYGDIIPNNRLIRVIAMVQILFSITIFGMFLTHVTRQPW